MNRLFFNPPKDAVMQALPFDTEYGYVVDADQHNRLVEDLSCPYCDMASSKTDSQFEFPARRVSIIVRLNDEPKWRPLVISKSLYDKIQELVKLSVDNSEDYQYNPHIELSFGVHNEWLRWSRR
jgi:hypothetical protein